MLLKLFLTRLVQKLLPRKGRLTWYSLSYKALDLVWSKIWDSGLLAGCCNRSILDIPRAKTGPVLAAKTSPEFFHRIVHRSSVLLLFLRPACGCFPPCFCRLWLKNCSSEHCVLFEARVFARGFLACLGDHLITEAEPQDDRICHVFELNTEGHLAISKFPKLR